MLRRGDRVDVRFTKWGGGRHWEFALAYLGSDEHARTLAAMNQTMSCRGPDQEGIWTGGRRPSSGSSCSVWRRRNRRCFCA